MGKKAILLLCTIAIFSGLTKPAFAVTIPNFPSCINPQGTLIASYRDGTHGIVGKTDEFRGSDKVYRVSDETVTQCFCEKNGRGIQTNWWKASSLTDDQIKILERSGWYYIPSGSAWGLDSGAYVAKNSEYSCLAIGGSVLGEATGSARIGKVLGLASTGSMEKIYDIWLAGLLLLTYGVWVKWYQIRRKTS